MGGDEVGLGGGVAYDAGVEDELEVFGFPAWGEWGCGSSLRGWSHRLWRNRSIGGGHTNSNPSDSFYWGMHDEKPCRPFFFEVIVYAG